MFVLMSDHVLGVVVDVLAALVLFNPDDVDLMGALAEAATEQHDRMEANNLADLLDLVGLDDNVAIDQEWFEGARVDLEWQDAEERGFDD